MAKVSCTSSPGDVDCDLQCTVLQAAGARVDLTAIPDLSFQFEGWGGDCQGNEASTSITLGDGSSCSANFIPVAVMSVRSRCA